MDNRTPEAEARKTLERHRTARFAWSTWATPLVLFVFISICAGASALLQVNTQQRIISAPAPLTNIPQIASSRVTSTHQLRVVFVDAKPGDNPDLFLSDVPSRTLTQLTNTPAITEAWPVFDSEGKLLITAVLWRERTSFLRSFFYSFIVYEINFFLISL